ncbi:MaoC family dehydratase [Bordetella pseudohinzii]|uniref:Bifunctional aldehyde dehydrogenase/enoyl-CoA hydratase n=1 Tax=Bordetella pseudohinzii TaxID=1331258 RepID=A0A0J6BRM8_9BORD|nr:MaoC family dehydratase [Bordetella pseudohinzii]ANY16101.1 dehydratase [Bordetella pseudohinzii]KMM24499.1 dehydratase [Bordetella pseudohinzii]KXA78522.1 dehydratase [Bordetella pseudohinzii]KXA78590.1 dehydratase [Bordetella pseudohinzii]CUJ10581.1 bifunctional aldehyde dehydrogenase/enoyl-CoA hydratase [Bordetella pseudohinzii]
MPAKRYLDDLAVGDSFISGEYTITRAEIIDFAQRYDPQPFHLSEEAARQSLFGGLAASGWHTAAVSMRLLVQSLPLAGGVIGAGGEISWPRPTRPGDVLRVRSEIMQIMPSRSKPDRAIVLLQSETLNQNAEVAQRFVSKLVVFRRPG